jgi:hypothetical protein
MANQPVQPGHPGYPAQPPAYPAQPSAQPGHPAAGPPGHPAQYPPQPAQTQPGFVAGAPPAAPRAELREGEHPEQFVATPQFTVFTETGHGAEFILSEANGELSRDTVTIQNGEIVKVGQTLKITTAATATAPAIATQNVTADTASDAVSIYAATAPAAGNLNIAVITRNAEVNGNLLYYPAAILAADKLAISKALLAHSVVVRN